MKGAVGAIVMKILCVLSVSLMLMLIKLVEGVPLSQVMFFRSFLTILPVIAYLAWRGGLRGAVATRRPSGHLIRTVLGLTTMGLTFVAVRALPLPEAVTLQYTQPLFVVALSALILRRPVRWFRWAAVAVGFLGVLIITLPKLSLLTAADGSLSQVQFWGALAALAAAATLAVSLLLMETLVRTDSPATMVIWFWIYASVILACTFPFGWVMPTPGQCALLALAGFLGGMAQMFLGESLRLAPAATTAPFEYTSLIFVSVLGYLAFGDVPDRTTIGGSVLLIAAGLAIVWRERRLGARASTESLGRLPPV